MEKTLFEQYFEPQISLQREIALLSDPSLSLEENREKIHKRLLNLLFKYIASFYEVEVGKDQQEMLYSISATHREVLSVLTGQYAHVPYNCLFDIPTNVAFLREIIFREFSPKTEAGKQNIVIDAGCGSGITLLGEVIAVERQGIQRSTLKAVGMDQNSAIMERAEKTLRCSFGESLDLEIIPRDITDPEVYKELCRERNLAYLVSETITKGYPEIQFGRNGVRNLGDRTYSYRLINEPFADVLHAVLQMRGFFEAVRDGEIGMFPDIIGGLYTPGGRTDQEIRLATAEGRRFVALGAIGDEIKEKYELPLVTKQGRF